MRKKIFYSALWGVLTIFLLFACRTEDNLSQQNNGTKQRFAIFVPQSPIEKVDYANGFAYLYQNYYDVNNIDKNQQEAVINNFGVVDFRIHSQLLTYKDGSKAMIFPIRQMGITKGLVMGILENEETNLRYVRLEENYEGYSGIIQNFSKNDKKVRVSDLATAAMKKNDDVKEHPDEPKRDDENGPTNPPEKTIPEVIIIVPAPLPTVPTIPIIPNVPVIPPGGGGCGAYGGCNLPPPGGGGTPQSKQDDDCAKLKAQQNTEEYKKRIDALEKKLKETHENGYIQDKDGNYSELTQRGESESSKSMRLPNDISNLRGFLHTHVKKTSVVIDGEVYEAEGVDMFSPADVERFLEIVKFSSDQGRPLDDVFGVMVSSSGNYTLKFTGDKNQIITKFQDNSLNIDVYLRYMQQTSGEFKNMSMEQKFLKYLDEYMNARGVSLYKDNKNGTNTRMDLDDSNKKEMKKSDC